MRYLNLFLVLGFFLAVIVYLFMYFNNTETFQQINEINK